jgi:hypothetical protein
MSTPAPATKLETVKKAVHDMLHEKSAFTPAFEMAEKYTKVSREYLFLGESVCWCGSSKGGQQSQ